MVFLVVSILIQTRKTTLLQTGCWQQGDEDRSELGGGELEPPPDLSCNPVLRARLEDDGQRQALLYHERGLQLSARLHVYPP